MGRPFSLKYPGWDQRMSADFKRVCVDIHGSKGNGYFIIALGSVPRGGHNSFDIGHDGALVGSPVTEISVLTVITSV